MNLKISFCFSERKITITFNAEGIVIREEKGNGIGGIATKDYIEKYYAIYPKRMVIRKGEGEQVCGIAIRKDIEANNVIHTTWFSYIELGLMLVAFIGVLIGLNTLFSSLE